MKLRAIFIDIDNTLLDFDEYVRQTMKTGFAHFGLKFYEPWMYEAFTEENNKLWRRIEDGTLSFDELKRIRWNNVFRRLGIDFDGPTFETYFRQCLNESAIEVEGAMDLLQTLSSCCRLCAASNGPLHQQEHRLELAGMRPYFVQLFISDDIGAAKPAKEFFEEAFRRLNRTVEGASAPYPIRPEECLMLGDSLTSDIAGGRQAGMKTCYFTRGRKAEKARADFSVDSLRDVPALLEKEGLLPKRMGEQNAAE